MQLRAITGTAVIRATVGGRICSLQLSVSKWLLYDSREETEHIPSTRQSMHGAQMDTSKGRTSVTHVFSSSVFLFSSVQV